MRHVPEAELACLSDQALSRSQCIEIETHLAACFRCQQERDAIAALRDRTTALLATAAPRRIPPLPYAVLAARAQTRRQRWWQRSAMWAASIAGAAIAGWGLRTALDPHGGSQPLPVAVERRPWLPRLSRDVGHDSRSGEPSAEPIFLAQPPSGPKWSDPTVRLASGGPAARDGAQPSDGDSQDASLSLDDQWARCRWRRQRRRRAGWFRWYRTCRCWTIRMRLGGWAEPTLADRDAATPSGAFIHIVEGPVTTVAAFVSAQLRRARRSIPASRPARCRTTSKRTGASIGPAGWWRSSARLPVDSLNALAQGVVLKRAPHARYQCGCLSLLMVCLSSRSPLGRLLVLAQVSAPGSDAPRDRG